MQITIQKISPFQSLSILLLIILYLKSQLQKTTTKRKKKKGHKRTDEVRCLTFCPTTTIHNIKINVRQCIDNVLTTGTLIVIIRYNLMKDVFYMTAINKNGQLYWTFEEEKLENGTENLLHYPQGGVITKAMHDEIFVPTYSAFLGAQGSERRKKFLPKNIVNVWWDKVDKTVNVKFSSGDWWHFTKKGEWY